MKSIPFLLSIAWLSLTTFGGGQQQAPAISYEPQADALRLQWESSRNRTFFPQASTGLDLWHYILGLCGRQYWNWSSLRLRPRLRLTPSGYTF
jgi:hypothetical protein